VEINTWDCDHNFGQAFVAWELSEVADTLSCTFISNWGSLKLCNRKPVGDLGSRISWTSSRNLWVDLPLSFQSLCSRSLNNLGLWKNGWQSAKSYILPFTLQYYLQSLAMRQPDWCYHQIHSTFSHLIDVDVPTSKWLIFDSFLPLSVLFQAERNAITHRMEAHQSMCSCAASWRLTKLDRVLSCREVNKLSLKARSAASCIVGYFHSAKCPATPNKGTSGRKCTTRDWARFGQPCWV